MRSTTTLWCKNTERTISRTAFALLWWLMEILGQPVHWTPGVLVPQAEELIERRVTRKRFVVYSVVVLRLIDGP